MQSDDPTVIRSLAVHVNDVVAALEARANGRPAVLRATPPFNGRMRARLHVESEGEYDTGPRPVHVPPGALVEGPPDYPTPDGTEDRLRGDPGRTCTPERHREYHVERVAAWREAVRECLRERATVETPAGPHEVRVVALG